MSQATLEDDDLFGEAAAEVTETIEEELAAARDGLPDPDAIWEAEADNVLGVLNTLRTQLDTGEAGEHLREAKKWFAIGSRAEVFDDSEAVEAEIQELATTIERIEGLHEDVGEIATILPQLRESLQDAPEE